MSKWNYLSENSSTSSDEEYVSQKKIKSLAGYSLSTVLDKRLH